MPIIKTDKTMRPRDKNDWYPTPKGLIRAALGLVPGWSDQALDPGAGTGIWGEVATELWPTTVEVTGIEIDEDHAPHPDYDFWETLDYRKSTLANNRYDLVMGNPPFKYAEEFIRTSQPYLSPDGIMIFLLRLAFLESQKRQAGLWKEYRPSAIHVLGRRPSFMGEGGRKTTDSAAYAIYVWGKESAKETSLNWLEWDYDVEVPSPEGQPTLFTVETDNE